MEAPVRHGGASYGYDDRSMRLAVVAGASPS